MCHDVGNINENIILVFKSARERVHPKVFRDCTLSVWVTCLENNNSNNNNSNIHSKCIIVRSVQLTCFVLTVSYRSLNHFNLKGLCDNFAKYSVHIYQCVSTFKHSKSIKLT